MADSPPNKRPTLSLLKGDRETLTLGSTSSLDQKPDKKVQQILSGKITKSVIVESKHRASSPSQAKAKFEKENKLTEKERIRRSAVALHATLNPQEKDSQESHQEEYSETREAEKTASELSPAVEFQATALAVEFQAASPAAESAAASPDSEETFPAEEEKTEPEIQDIPAVLSSPPLPEEAPKREKKGFKPKSEKKKLKTFGDSYEWNKKSSLKNNPLFYQKDDDALLDTEEERGEEILGLRRKRKKTVSEESRTVIREVKLPETIKVQELANRMARRVGDVIKELMKIGVMATINQEIDADTAEIIITECGHRVRRVNDIEEGLAGPEDRAEDLHPRPPVVTVMGHVDHGKTSLLDRLRQTNVVDKEAGGITQHIGAYQVRNAPFGSITFIDTPGHEIFTQMRNRGARITDIVILVVAADDGIMPQTIEAIHHAQAAKVPLILAINKIDLPAANPQKIREDLLRYEIAVEKMGGEVLEVEVSAKSGRGLEALLEAIVLQAEMLNLRANPNRPASGVVLESKLDRRRGALVSVLVQRGTLKPGDLIVVGQTWGKARLLTSDRGCACDQAPPSMPVEISGMNAVALAGEPFFVVEKEAKARQIVQSRLHKKRSTEPSLPKASQEMFNQNKVTEIPVILKADTHGSLEAMTYAIADLNAKVAEVTIAIRHSAVGAVHETDVAFAQTCGALIFSFNVRAHPQAVEAAKRENISIQSYSVIYHFIEEMKKILEKNLEPTLQEKILGSAKVNKIFVNQAIGTIAGCLVVRGCVRRGSDIRLFRDHTMIHQGRIKSLRRFKDEAKEVREGYECGIVLENHPTIQLDDIIEAFDVEEVPRSI